MKKAITILVLTLFSGILHFSYGQEDTLFDLPNVIPLSPEAAAFGKHLETNVSLQSGIPKIEIPLYTINEGSHSLPISLSYHSGGIKVEEVASSVGLGWSLNAGGMISRIIRGKVDDIPTGYMYTSNTVAEFRTETQYDRFTHITYANQGYRDYEADIFIFNFPGGSGRFQYNRSTNSFIQIPYSNIEIVPEFDGHQLISWVITGSDGVKYYFGESIDGNRTVTENSTTIPIQKNHQGLTQFLQDNQSNHIESWMLTDIVYPNNKEINFIYEWYNTVDLLRVSEIRSKAVPGTYDNHITNYIQKSSNTNFLKEIRFPSGKVVFEAQQAQRLDFIGGKVLEKMTLFDKDNNFIKKFDFSYDYSYSSISDGVTLGGGSLDEARRYRLKLSSIQQTDENNSTLPPYEFFYNLTPLPARLSKDQDFWGYFNGKQNISLLPKVAFTPILGSNGEYLYLGQADRSIDLNKVKAETLEKIKLPTGGEVEYFLESNEVSRLSFVGDFPNFAPVTGTTNTEIANSSNYLVEDPNYNYSMDFTIPSSIIGPVSFAVDLMSGCVQCCNSINCDYELTVRDSNDTILFYIQSPTGFHHFEPGTYKITGKYVGDGNIGDGDFYVSLEWKYEIHPNGNPNHRYFGGLRTAKVEQRDNQGSTLVERYEYNEFGTTKSSGYAISSPIFFNSDYFCGIDGSNVYKISSQTQLPLTQSHGGYIGYENVTKFQDYNNNLGKTEFIYSSHLYDYEAYNEFDEYIETYPGTYYPPPSHTDWLRGNLLEKRVYEYLNIFKIRKIIKNEYERDGVYLIPDYGVSYEATELCEDSTITFKYSLYHLFSEWHRIKKTITEDYLPNGEVEQTTEYFYNSNAVLPSHTETTYYESGSNVKTVETHYQYPFDLLPHTQMQNLVNQNRISQPVKVTRKVNGTAVQTTNTVYATNTNTSGLTMPVTIQADKGNGTNLENRIHYERYDNKGNPLQVSMNSGPKIAYIWGYHDQFPVAKIENATYADAIAVNGLNLSIINNPSSETALRNEINKIRDALPNAMVTTYMYKPLVGITRMIDPKGDEIRYYYDAFGRLDHIRDKQGNLLEEYEYNYREN